MKTDYKVDFRGQTAAHFTTFGQTMQSQTILAKNREKLASIAQTASSTISSAAANKARSSMLGAKLSLYV